MLDKRTSRFLVSLARICSDGSYKIIDKTELMKVIQGSDATALSQMVRFLQDNEMIDVKYSDETVYCLTVLPKGRVTSETTKGNHRAITRIELRVIVGLIVGCFLASMFGAMLGSFFFSLA